MRITEGRVAEIAARYSVSAEVAAQIIRDAGVTVVPDFAGGASRPGETIPTDRLHESDLVGELQPDGQVWVAKSKGGQRKRFITQDAWYRLAEAVAQAGGSAYLHEP